MVEFKRRLYRRGSSYETTIPMPLLFTLDPEMKYNVVFRYDAGGQKWYVEFEKRNEGNTAGTAKGKKAKARK
jgi:hypothetical protein